MEPKQDMGFFDGSCDPNPGGRMGAGWRIVWGDKPEQTGSAEWAADGANTVNVAEYSALIGLLSEYHAAGGQGPLMVYGDSQLIIRQMTGEYSVRSPQLATLNQEASQLARGIPGGVSFRWVPREQNALADTLASGVPPGAQEPAIYAWTAPDVPAPLAAAITRLNQQGRMSFKEAMNLRLGGTDRYSRLYLADLTTHVGAPCAEAATTAFPGADAASIKARESALRWMCRGLAAHLAIRKVKVDLEVRANAEKGRGGGQW